MVGGPPLLNYTRSSRDNFAKRLIGDNFVRMGKSGRRRKPKVINIKSKIERALSLFFYSDARLNEYRAAQARVTASVGKARSFSDAMKVAHKVGQKLSYSINPPPPSSAPEIEALATALTTYFKVAGGLSSQKAVSVYTALMLQVLRDGLKIDKTVVVHQSPFVRRYGPSDMQLGKLSPNVSCRAISSFFRRFKRTVTTAQGHPRADSCIHLPY